MCMEGNVPDAVWAACRLGAAMQGPAAQLGRLRRGAHTAASRTARCAVRADALSRAGLSPVMIRTTIGAEGRHAAYDPAWTSVSRAGCCRLQAGRPAVAETARCPAEAALRTGYGQTRQTRQIAMHDSRTRPGRSQAEAQMGMLTADVDVAQASLRPCPPIRVASQRPLYGR
jgi:hypothetical protein